MFDVVATDTVKNDKKETHRHANTERIIVITLGCFAVLTITVLAICIAIKLKGMLSCISFSFIFLETL